MFWEKIIFGLGITDVVVIPGRAYEQQKRRDKAKLFIGPQSKGVTRGKEGKRAKARIENGGMGGFTTGGVVDWVNVRDDDVKGEARVYDATGTDLVPPLKKGETYSRRDSATGEELRITYKGTTEN